MLTVVTSTMILLVLDSSILGVMLPTMERDLALSRTESSWLVSIYLLTLAVFAPVGGRLVDALGAVRVFRIGMIGFVLASVIIAVVPVSSVVLIGRGSAGVAGAMLMPATLALLLGEFREEHKARAMAVYIGVGQGFALVGPLAGGICAQYLGWRWGFLVNVPVGVVALILLTVVAPANVRTRGGPWDLGGLILVVVGLGAVVTALLEGPTWGWASPLTLTVGAAGVAALAAYPRLARRVPDPILDLALLHSSRFALDVTLLAALGFSMTVATVYGAVALQKALHVAPAAAGLALLPLIIPSLIATRVIGARYERFGLRRVLVSGFASMALGLAVCAIGFGTTSVTVTTLGLVPLGVGMGATLSPLNTATPGAVATSRRGQASGLMTAGRQLGGIVGVAVFAAIVAAVPGRSGTTVGFLVTAAVTAVAALAALVPTSDRGADR